MDPLTTEGAGNADDVEKANENSTRTPAQSLPNFVGKHRMTAAISLLNQQIQFLQEEIDQLDTFGGSSIVCKELIASVESNSDALLPVWKRERGDNKLKKCLNWDEQTTAESEVERKSMVCTHRRNEVCLVYKKREWVENDKRSNRGCLGEVVPESPEL
ncbi:uncharacterized protein LOC141683953 isoform X1 [Apium graveolens]|uniref:uncharacterized protein LOC141683953 isoform X1 n=1 Tax=Apium graveolens TaxID=4045 RepID=UPI003D7927DA